MSSSQQIRLGAIMAYIAIGINIISGLVYTPWMIRSIGRENFGLYTLAMSVISLFVFDFGLGASVTRFIAKYLAEGRQDKANNCLGLVYRLYFVLDVILFIVLAGLYFFIPQIYKELTPDEIDKFKVIYIMVSIYSVISFPFIPVKGILTAHEKFIQIHICDVFHKVIIVVLMTFCLLLGYGLYSLVLVNTFAGVATILAKLWVIKHYTPQKVSLGYHNKQEFHSIIGFSGWVTVIALAQRLIFSLAPSILGMFSGSTSIAILGIATTIEGYTFTFANALNGMFLPKVSRVISKNPQELLHLMTKVGRVQIIIVGLIVVGFSCLGKDFIHLWVGEDFSASYLCALLIVIPTLFSTPQDVANSAVLAMNKVKKQAIVFIATSVFNVILILLLVKQYAALAVCISVCVTYFLRTAIMDFVYWKEMQIEVLAFFKNSYGKMALALILATVFGVLINIVDPFETTWLTFIVKGGLFVVVYAIVMWLFGMNSYEKELLLSPIRKLLKQ